MPGPLSGIRILDFTWALAGPFGTMALCDLGAEVWKVEAVGLTEQTRGPGPMVDGINTYYFSVNRGKKSILIDLKSDTGRELALSLAEQVDVVTENFSPGTMASLGLDYAAMSARNPRLIYASTSGFGQTGPYTGRGALDVIVQGMSGLMSITGHEGGPPARAGYSIGDMAGGLFTALGIVSALVERSISGRGQQVDVAMLDSQVTLLENAVIRHFATGEVPEKIGTRHPLVTPFQAFPTSDGYVVIAGVKDWPLFCGLVERDDLIDDARFRDNGSRTRNHAELEPILNETMARRTSAEWIETLSPTCLIAPLNTIDEMVRDPHLAAREMFVDLPSWKGRTFRVSNSPVRLSRTPVALSEGADRPGGHTRDILRDGLGLDDAAVEELLATGAISEGDIAGG